MDVETFLSFSLKLMKYDKPSRIHLTFVDHVQELMATTQSVFGPALGSAVIFETSDLNVCQGDTAVENTFSCMGSNRVHK
jgi:hypothetical protein